MHGEMFRPYRSCPARYERSMRLDRVKLSLVPLTFEGQ